jgi:glutamate-1-semialdehyde 2,1-aminomutase
VVATRSEHGFPLSAERVQEACAVMPGGVTSDFRLGVSPTPLVVERADGPYVFDVDGHRLIDYYLGMGPMMLGHRPAAVVEAAAAQLERGILFGAQSEIDYEAARLVVDMVPCADLVRFGTTGTEANQTAFRLARAATGRTQIVAFEGHYHGWLDNVAWSSAQLYGELGAFSKGQDMNAIASLELLPWNDVDRIVDRLSARDVAGVIMEPAMCNTSAVPPRPGYLEAVREACTANGTVLIFDEVITGFRLAPGGAQAYFDVTPDLATFAKALANGFPVSCIAGRRELMEQIGGPGKVVHAGTYNGQAVSMAAAVATLTALRDGSVHAFIETQGRRLMDGVRALLAKHDIPGVVQGWPQIFHVSFGRTEPIMDFRDSLTADRRLYVQFTSALLERGVRALERGAWFLSAEHDNEVIDATLEAVDGALSDVVG